MVRGKAHAPPLAGFEYVGGEPAFSELYSSRLKFVEDFSTVVVRLSEQGASDEEFQSIINIAISNGIASLADLGEAVGISRSTISRWAIGSSAPHPAVRKIILKVLADQSFEHGKALEQAITEPKPHLP